MGARLNFASEASARTAKVLTQPFSVALAEEDLSRFANVFGAYNC
jgi:hypothetical protein